MNFKLNIIPGNSAYINYKAIKDCHGSGMLKSISNYNFVEKLMIFQDISKNKRIVTECHEFVMSVVNNAVNVSLKKSCFKFAFINSLLQGSKKHDVTAIVRTHSDLF